VVDSTAVVVVGAAVVDVSLGEEAGVGAVVVTGIESAGD